MTTALHSVATPVLVRPATAGDVRACRMLLPETADDRAAAHAVATAPDGRAVAAAGWTLPPNEAMSTWRVAVHVISPFRGLGVERQLLGFVRQRAAEAGVTTLDWWHWPDSGGPHERELVALGFGRVRSVFEFELDPAEVCRTTGPLLDRVRRRGRIPANAEVVSLAEADPRQVADLHVRQLGGTARSILPLLTGRAARSYDPYISTVLRVDGRVLGFNLYRYRTVDTGDEDATVLDPSMRNTWAMLWLMNEHARRGVEQGVRAGRFTTFDRDRGAWLVGFESAFRLVSERAWMQMPTT